MGSEGSIHASVPAPTALGDGFTALDACQSSQADRHTHSLADGVGKPAMCNHAENSAVHRQAISAQGLLVVVPRVDHGHCEPDPNASGLHDKHGHKHETARTESINIEDPMPLSTKQLVPPTPDLWELALASGSANTTAHQWQPPHSAFARQAGSTPSHISGSPVACSPHNAVDTVEDDPAVSESRHSVSIVQGTVAVQVQIHWLCNTRFNAGRLPGPCNTAECCCGRI